MLNCRWQAIEPRGITAWEATHSAQRSLVGGEIRRLHQLKPQPWARKLAPTFVYSVAFARITAIRAAVVETSMP
jgi:hypothetical protein